MGAGFLVYAYTCVYVKEVSGKPDTICHQPTWRDT